MLQDTHFGEYSSSINTFLRNRETNSLDGKNKRQTFHLFLHAKLKSEIFLLEIPSTARSYFLSVEPGMSPEYLREGPTPAKTRNSDSRFQRFSDLSVVLNVNIYGVQFVTSNTKRIGEIQFHLSISRNLISRCHIL